MFRINRPALNCSGTPELSLYWLTPDHLSVCAECTFAGFNNLEAPLMSLYFNSSAVFEGCTIRQISSPSMNGASIRVWGDLRQSTVVLRGTSVTASTAPFFSTDTEECGSACFYTDSVGLMVYREDKDEIVPSLGIGDIVPGKWPPMLRVQDRPGFLTVCVPMIFQNLQDSCVRRQWHGITT